MPKKETKFLAGVYLSISVIVLVVLIGTLFYKFYENLSWIDAIYFTTMTVVTVGFGDLAPTKPVSRAFTTVFALISIPAILFSLGYIIEEFLKGRISHVEDKMDTIIREENEIIQKEKEILEKEEKILSNREN